MEEMLTRTEIYLRALSGEYTGEIPEPVTREERHLHNLCINGVGSGLSDEEINAAIQDYLENNDVSLNISGGTFADWGDK